MKHQVAHLALVNLAVASANKAFTQEYVANTLQQSNPFWPTSRIEEQLGRLPSLAEHIGFDNDTLQIGLDSLMNHRIEDYGWQLFQEVLSIYQHIFTPEGYLAFYQACDESQIKAQISQKLGHLVTHLAGLNEFPAFTAYLDSFRHNEIKHEFQNTPRPRYFRFEGSAAQLTPKDFFPNRFRSFRDYYLTRPYLDDSIAAVIETARSDDPQSALVRGDSLSGKTRAIYQALKNPTYAAWRVLILEVGDIGADFEVPTDPNQPTVAFIDDIDNLLRHNGAIRALTRFRDAGVSVLATCRLGPEFDAFIHIVEEKATNLLDRWQTYIEIQPLSKQVLKTAKDKDPDFPQDMLAEDWEKGYDQNLGSALLPLNAMRSRYEKLNRGLIPEVGGKWKRNRRPIAQLCVQILKGLKAMYFAGNYIERSRYDKSKTLDLLARWNQIDGRPDISQDRLEEAWDVLQRSEYDLRFLSESPDEIRIEEAYLEKVIAPEYTFQHIVDHIYQAYPNQWDMRARGFFTRTIEWNKLIHQTGDFDKAQALRAEMEAAGLKPTVVTYNSLIALSQDWEKAQALRAEMEAAGLKPTVVTYNSLIALSQDWEKAQALRAEMEAAGLKPTVVTYNSLIALSQDWETKKNLLGEMLDHSIFLDRITLDQVCKGVQLTEQAEELINFLADHDLHPPASLIMRMVKKADGFGDATRWIDRFREM